MMENVQQLLKEVGPGKTSDVPYDTAWVARLGDIDWELSSHALNWLSDHQLPDGSWGAEKPHYYHDRIISTLAAMIALTYRGRRASDREQIERGLVALEQITEGAADGLSNDPNGATVGFEMIVPTLVAEAERLGIIKQQGERILGKLGRVRQAKMEKLSGIRISRLITAAHSAEMVGTDNLDLLDAENLQEQNGSIANSPAATAYFALAVDPGNEAALNYLRQIISADGGIPPFAPFDIFERVWILWNLQLTQQYLDPNIRNLCKPHLDYIEQKWVAEQGLGFSASYSLPDGDNTMVGYEVLSRYGRNADLKSVFNYEEQNWFRCYHLETKRSIDVNIHALGALRQAGFERTHPSVRKAVDFVREARAAEGYWLDKWNASPYYTTSHAVILCREYDNELCEDSVGWMLKTQMRNGAWGFYGFPTAEETAYCLQALIVWKRSGGRVPAEAIRRASQWLAEHSGPPYPSFWIDKSLYRPDLLVQSSILSALVLAQEEGIL